MIDFKPITPKDNNIFKEYYLNYNKNHNAENSFANLCCYSFIYKGEYAIINNFLVTRIHFDLNKHICYYLPIGNGENDSIIDLIIKDSKENNYKLSFVADKDFNDKYKQYFDFTDIRNMYDYLYLRENLSELKGKKYQPKRNHINQFNTKYQYQFIRLNKNDKQQCLQMLNIWRKQEMNISPEYKRDYDDEQYVIEYLFDYFEELDIFGGGLIVDNKLIAFSLGSYINNDTFDTHIEKADRDYIGSFTVINKEMAIHLPDNYIYINREEDKGIMGLRQAKLSYHPYQLIEKRLATYIL